MCGECMRLQASYTDASERLKAGQRELAAFKGSTPDDFTRLWNECLKGLGALSSLREHLAAHRAAHGQP